MGGELVRIYAGTYICWYVCMLLRIYAYLGLNALHSYAHSPQKKRLCPVHVVSSGEDGQLREVVRRSFVILVGPSSSEPPPPRPPLPGSLQHGHASLALRQQLPHTLSEARPGASQRPSDAGRGVEGRQQEEALGGVGRQRQADPGQQPLDQLHALHHRHLRARREALDEGHEVGVEEVRRADDLEDLQHDLSLKVVLEDPAQDPQRLQSVVRGQDVGGQEAFKARQLAVQAQRDLVDVWFLGQLLDGERLYVPRSVWTLLSPSSPPAFASSASSASSSSISVASSSS